MAETMRETIIDTPAVTPDGVWYKGQLSLRASNLLDAGFELVPVRKRYVFGEKKSYIDQSHVYFTVLDTWQRWVVIYTQQKTERGRRRRILTSYLASQCIETDYEPASADIQAELSADPFWLHMQEDE
jgi:hypothetical protein